MGILIRTVRIYGFRGLQNIEVELEQTTVLTGMNNTGKTTFLKALNSLVSDIVSLFHKTIFLFQIKKRVQIRLLLI